MADGFDSTHRLLKEELEFALTQQSERNCVEDKVAGTKLQILSDRQDDLAKRLDDVQKRVNLALGAIGLAIILLNFFAPMIRDLLAGSP